MIIFVACFVSVMLDIPRQVLLLGLLFNQIV